MRANLSPAKATLWLMTACLCAGCSGGGPSDPTGSAHVRAQLIRLPGNSASSAPAYLASPASVVGSFPWSSRVTLTSVRAPITGITLWATDGSHVQLYSCPATTSSGCLVELDGPELQALLGTTPVAVPVGTYDRVDVSYCIPPETKRQAQVTGTAVIAGVTYYTNTSGILSTTAPAEPVPIDFQGCGDGFPIAPSLDITDATVATTVVGLYFDVVDLAAAALGNNNVSSMAVGGRCAVKLLGTDPIVCAAYPVVTAVVGTTPPVVEHYHVNNGATIGLVFDAGTDLFYGGYFRRYFVEDQAWIPGFPPDGGVASFTRNSDGTYRLSQGSGLATFPAWQRASHTGSFDFSGASVPYSATRF